MLRMFEVNRYLIEEVKRYVLKKKKDIYLKKKLGSQDSLSHLTVSDHSLSDFDVQLQSLQDQKPSGRHRST